MNTLSSESKPLNPKTQEILARRRAAQIPPMPAMPTAATEPESTPIVPAPQAVTVVDVSMPFGSMVVFMLKWAFASIPAMFIIGAVFGVIALVLGGFAALLGLGAAAAAG